MNSRGLRKWWPALLTSTVLTGCAASRGPDYVPPADPQETRYRPERRAATDPEGAVARQHMNGRAEVPRRWWQAFGSPEIDALVTRAIAASPTLESAQASVAQADALVRAAGGSLYPQLSLQATATRGNSAAIKGGTGAAGNQLGIGPLLTYAPDVFGSTARRIELARAQADLQFAQQAAAELALAGNTTVQAIALAGARAQALAAQDIVALDERNVELVRVATEGGKSAHLDLLTAESQLASDRALLPPLLQQESVAVHALAVLQGRATAEPVPPLLDLEALTVPADVPLVLPSQLVRRRPDIAAAEAQLHEANAAIGIATAQLYPSVTLSASWTSVAATAGGLFGSGTSVWNLAADLLAPVFSGHALQAQRDAAVEAYAAQLADYRQVVLQAFAQLADLLDALDHDAALAFATRRALDAASTVAELTQQSYQVGQANLLQLLDAQRQYQQARLADVRARAQQLGDTAQLFIAMGGAVPVRRTEPTRVDSP